MSLSSIRYMVSVIAPITQKERTVNAARRATMTRPGGRLQLRTHLNAEVSVLLNRQGDCVHDRKLCDYISIGGDIAKL